MKSFISLGFLAFALSFCSLSDTLSKFTGSKSTNANVVNSVNSNTSATSVGENVESLTLNAAQQAILDKGKETKWDAQGMSWKLPQNWEKMGVTQTLLNYRSPDSAFLIVTISPMGADFPVEASIKAYYDGAVSQKKLGKYDAVRYLEIDGVKGVEYTETMPEAKDDPRRHQWISYRKFAGQTQMVNLMLSTKGSNFDKHQDDFAAILASTKLVK